MFGVTSRRRDDSGRHRPPDDDRGRHERASPGVSEASRQTARPVAPAGDGIPPAAAAGAAAADGAAAFHQPDENSTLTAAEHSASDASSAGGPEEVDAACLGCTRVARRRARLACGHAWCRRCLRTQVRNALRGGDGAWPPRCCAGAHGEIREGVVEWLGDRGVWDMYRRRRTEMAAPVGERVYCHLITCATFIPPAHHIRAGDQGRGGRVALCPQAGCGRQTCVECGTAAHVGLECPRDPDMEAVMQTIEAHGYQFCAVCNAIVERVGGCNHITCRCGYHFCYLCGVQWKACLCALYGGARVQRHERPRLEEIVREQITAPQLPEAATRDPVAQPPPAAPIRARPPVVRRAPSPPLAGRVRDDGLVEHPGGNGGQHLHEPGIRPEAQRLQEGAWYGPAMWIEPRQEQILGIGGGGYPAGGIVLGAPTLTPGETVRYHYVLAGQPGGAQVVGAYHAGMGYGQQVVPAQYLPATGVRWMMYQTVLGADMTGGYYMWH